MADGQLLLIAGALLTSAVVASMLATRLRVPALLLFLFLGMAIGSDSLGWIDFSDYRLARTIGTFALAIILFEGGLTSGILEIRPVLKPALSLAFIGTILTALITGLAAAWLFDFKTLEGLLLGSIVAATDCAATFAVLRGSTLKRRLARTLEAESGLNDPIAVLLVIGFTHWIQRPGYGIEDMLVLFVQQLGIGLAVGVAIGGLAVLTFQRTRFSSAGLYPVASLAAAGLAFGGAETLHGSGFFAIYIAGLMLGTAPIPAKMTITVFHQGLSWVAQVALFITLGLLAFPHELPNVAIESILLALVLVFLARPIATILATIGHRFSVGERIVLTASGLRGAVPVVLAIFPVIEGVPKSVEFFNIVLFAVVISTLIQGTSIEWLARVCKVTSTEPLLPRPLAESGTVRGLGAEVLEYPIGHTDAIVGARIRDLGLPRQALVNVIIRDEQAIPPRGSTILRAGDQLHVLLRDEERKEIPHFLHRWSVGPIGRERPKRQRIGRTPIFTIAPASSGWVQGDLSHPDSVRSNIVIEQLRVRRDTPGSLVILADGRYAITGALIILGSREALQNWARRRLNQLSDSDEVAWLEDVVGALAAEASAG